MALKVEGVVDGGVNAEKTLSGAGRLEPLHFALASSHRLMRVFGSVVLRNSCSCGQVSQSSRVSTTTTTRRMCYAQRAE